MFQQKDNCEFSLRQLRFIFEKIAENQTIWLKHGIAKEKGGYSQHGYSYIIGSPNRSTNKEIGQPHVKCEHDLPTSTSLRIRLQVVD